MAKNTIQPAIDEVNKSINTIINKINELDRAILTTSKNARENMKDIFSVKTPGDANRYLLENKAIIEKLNMELETQRQKQLELQKVIERLSQTRAVSNQKTAEEIINQQRLARNAKEYAIISSRLSTEYEKQSVILTQLQREYKDVALVQGENSREARALLTQINRLDAKLKRLDANVGQYGRVVGKYGSHWQNIIPILRSAAGAFGIFSGLQIAREIFQQVKEIQGLDFALKAVTKSQGEFNNAQKFLKEVANEGGLEINTLKNAYTKFYASAINKMPVEEINSIFSKISKSAGILGLSIEQQDGAFRALEQMMSKGNIQAEELRGQLAERLPNAFGIMAKSMGVSEMELNKLLKDGKVLAAEVLPKFAEEYEKSIGGDKIDSVRTLTAEQNRLSNSWKELIGGFSSGESIVSKVGIFLFREMTMYIQRVGVFLKEISINFKLLGSYLNDIFPKDGVVGSFFKKLVDGLSNTNNEVGVFKLGLILISKFFFVDIPTAVNTTLSHLEKFKNNIVGTYNLIKNVVPEIVKYLIDLVNPLKTASKDNIQNKIAQSLKKTLDLNKKITEETKKENKVIFKTWVDRRKAAEEAIDAQKEFSNIITNNNKGGDGDGGRKREKEKELKLPSLGIVDPPDVVKKKYREALKSVIEGVYGSLDTSAEKGLLELEDFINTDGVTIGLKVLADQLGVTYDELYGEFTSLYQKDYDNFLKYSQLKAEQASKEAELRLEAEEKAIQLLSDIGNTYFETRLNKIDEQIQKNNEYYDNIINNEESSEEQKKIAETQKEKRNKQLEDKKKKEQRKALIFQRIIDIGNVLRSDAMARSAALAPPPVGLGPVFGASLFPFITLNTALSLGSIVAQTIPAFEKGKKAGEPYEGPAIWGEKRHEVKYSKDGSIEVSPSKPTFTYVQRDDVVYPSVGDFLSAHPEFSAQQLERVAFDANHARGTFTLPYTHLGKQLATLKTEVKQGVKEGLSHFKNHITIQNRVNLPHLNWKNNKGYV